MSKRCRFVSAFFNALETKRVRIHHEVHALSSPSRNSYRLGSNVDAIRAQVGNLMSAHGVFFIFRFFYFCLRVPACLPYPDKDPGKFGVINTEVYISFRLFTSAVCIYPEHRYSKTPLLVLAGSTRPCGCHLVYRAVRVGGGRVAYVCDERDRWVMC